MVDIRKIEAILAYFANNTDTQYLGKVKLMKLFYFLDFTHAKKYGAPVTYDTYYNLQHGPIPSRIKNIVDDASDANDNDLLSDVIKFEFPDGTEMCRVLPNREFSTDDEALFSETELAVLKEVSQRFKNSRTQEVEDASHSESPWRETEFTDKIPYYLAAHDKDALVSEEEINLSVQIS